MMNTTKSVLLTGAALVMVLAAWSAPALAQTYEVGGVVLDAQTKMPVPGTAVAVLRASTRDTLATDSTDAQGRYRVDLGTLVSAEAIDVPEGYEVRLDGPNPITAATSAPLTLRYTTPGHVPERPALEVYDVQGRRVDVAAPLASGVYFARLRFESGYLSPAEKLVLLDRRTLDLRVVRAAPTPRVVPETVAGKQGAVQAVEVIVVAEKAFYHVREATHQIEANTEAVADVALEPVLVADQADSVTYDVTYKPSTVVVDGAARDALVRADTSSGQFVFETAALSASGTTLTAGQVMLIEGVALRRITSVSENGGEVVVETSFASLEEAIQDGEIGWVQELDFSDEHLPGVVLNAGGKSATYDAAQNKITLSFKAGAYEYKVELTPTTADSAEVKVEVTKDISGLKARLTGLARLRKIKSKASASFKDGKLERMSYENQNQELLIKLNLAAAGPGIQENDIGFQVPTALFRYVFLAGPIPIQTDFKVQFVFRMKVDPNASATAETTLRYTSDAGIEYQGTTIEAKNVTAKVTSDGSKTDAASTFIPVDLQFGVAFPRMEVSVLSTPLIGYFRVGFFIGSSLTWGPLCKVGFWRVTLDAGADLKIFSTTPIPLVNAVLWEEKKEAKSDGCPSGKTDLVPVVMLPD